MIQFFQKYVSRVIPLEHIIPLISCFGLNMLVYSGAMTITKNWKHYDFTSDFDRMIPVIPWFMYIYFGCYIFWVVNYILVGHMEKDDFYRFVTMDMTSRIVCGLCFFLLPTTNIRPEVIGNSFSEIMLRFCYWIDAPSNLFPSIHCLVSWFCFTGIRSQKTVPFWYKVFSCIFAIAVMVSTQVTKQHYIIDVIGAVVLAESLVFIVNHTSYYKYIQRFFEALNAKIAKLFLKEAKLER